MSRYTQGGAYGMPLMKFTLTYDGELPSCTGSNTRTKEKWEIRKALHPQLVELWAESEILKTVLRDRLIPKGGGYLRFGEHHSARGSDPAKFGGTNVAALNDRMDLCAPIKVVNREFCPLVRNSYALKCSLKIKFLRKEEPGGSLITQSGDIDNRLKTLFDALAVPNQDQLKEDPSAENPIYCLLEDDGLITGIDVDTQKLLSRPGSSKSEVRLVIDVDVRAIQATDYNLVFLSD
jgi:hypothetical protein